MTLSHLIIGWKKNLDTWINWFIEFSEGRDTPLSPPPPSNSSAQTSPQSLGYTCGPIDGSLYAVVQQGAAHSGGAARGSPLTVSMDSGISSAPPQRPSPPDQIQSTESQVHGDLDQLLHDMMMTVEVNFNYIIFLSHIYIDTKFQ